MVKRSGRFLNTFEKKGIKVRITPCIEYINPSKVIGIFKFIKAGCHPSSPKNIEIVKKFAKTK